MIVNIDMTNMTDKENLILNVKQDGHLIHHSNKNKIKSIREELLKIIGEEEWKEE